MKYSTRVYEAVVEYLLENEGIIADWAYIDEMDKHDVLDYFLKWEGIIGYTWYIIDIMESK